MIVLCVLCIVFIFNNALFSFTLHYSLILSHTIVQLAYIFIGGESSSTTWLAIFNFDPTGTSGSAHCVGPINIFDKLVITIFIPAFSLAFLFATFLISSLFHAITMTKKGDDAIEQANARRNRYIRTCVALFLYTYTNIAYTTTSFFQCVQITPTVKLMSAKPAINCDSTQYKQLSALMYLTLLFYVIGGPLVMLWILKRNYNKLYNEVWFYRFGMM